MRLLPAILANIFLVVSALGFGNLLRCLFPEAFSKLDRLALTLLGGLGILGTVLFCVGQFWFCRTAIIVVLLIGVLLAVKPLVTSGKDWLTTIKKMSLPVLPALVVSVILLVTAIGGLALITGDMNNDSIAYHYLGPKVWLREGVIRPVPDEVLTYFPVVVETQYAALMALGGQRAPDLFAFISLVTVLLIAASLAIRLGLDSSGAWWVAALLVTMPAVYRGAYGGFLDVLFAAFILAAARVGFDAVQPGHYALFGLFCGISMGTKYTGIIACGLLIFCSLLISLWARPQSYMTALKYLGISSIVAVGMASPLYLRNWILYGCPIYPPPPLLLRYFEAKNMTPAVMQELLKAVLETGEGMGRGIGAFLLLPFNLTYHTANFRGAGGIGLAPLAFAPFGLIASRRIPFAIGLALFSVLQTIAWFLTAQVSRYLIPIYVIAAIFAVLGWQYSIRAASRYARALSCIVIAISISYGLVMILPDRWSDMHAALSRSYEANRRVREIPRVESFEFINSDPSVRKVLILNGGIAAYFIDKPYIKPFGRWGEQTLPGVTDINQALSQIHNLHISHILAVKTISGSFELPEKPKGLTLVFEREDQRIYRVD